MIKDKKTAIVGSLVGCVILLTIFCCEGNKEAVEAVPTAETAIEEVIAPVTKAVEELKESVEEVIEEVTPEVEEVIPTETVVPAETAE